MSAFPGPWALLPAAGSGEPPKGLKQQPEERRRSRAQNGRCWRPERGGGGAGGGGLPGGGGRWVGGVSPPPPLPQVPAWEARAWCWPRGSGALRWQNASLLASCPPCSPTQGGSVFLCSLEKQVDDATVTDLPLGLLRHLENTTPRTCVTSHSLQKVVTAFPAFDS